MDQKWAQYQISSFPHHSLCKQAKKTHIVLLQKGILSVGLASKNIMFHIHDIQSIWLFVENPVIQQHCGLGESEGDRKGCLFESLVSLSSPQRLQSSATCFLSPRNEVFPAQPGSCTLPSSLPPILRKLHMGVGEVGNIWRGYTWV